MSEYLIPVSRILSKEDYDALEESDIEYSFDPEGLVVFNKQDIEIVKKILGGNKMNQKLNIEDAQQIEGYYNDRKFTFFFHKSSPFSQWYIREFKEDGITFNCMEKYMMYYKALLFQDTDILTKILKETEPSEHKKLGRKVKNFDEKIWDKYKIDIVMRGNVLKFSQNPDLKEILLSTKGTMLVEASPYDIIWGCGLSKDDPGINDPKNWTGENILGGVLTVIREGFLKGSI